MGGVGGGVGGGLGGDLVVFIVWYSGLASAGARLVGRAQTAQNVFPEWAARVAPVLR